MASVRPSITGWTGGTVHLPWHLADMRSLPLQSANTAHVRQAELADMFALQGPADMKVGHSRGTECTAQQPLHLAVPCDSALPLLQCCAARAPLTIGESIRTSLKRDT